MHANLRAVPVNLSPIRRAKDRLPRQVEIATIVTYVHDAFFHEPVADALIDGFINLATISERRVSTDWRRLGAEEVNFPGPLVRVRVFVVQRDMLVCGIFGRGVNSRSDI